MVLDVPRITPCILFTLVFVLEFRKYHLQGFIEDIGEGTQSTSMSHPEHQIGDLILTTLIDECVETRNECIVTLQPKSLAGGELGLQVFIEDVGARQSMQRLTLSGFGVLTLR